MLTDVLFLACPVLIIAGIVLKTNNRFKQYSNWSKYLILGGIACFALSMAIGWDDVVRGFNAGYEAASN